jgi:hypothetical protein
MADHWVPYAQENDIVLVFPQVSKCWDIGESKDYSVGAFPNETYLSQRSFQMNFLMQIMSKVFIELDKDYNYLVFDLDIVAPQKKDQVEDINAASRNEEEEGGFPIIIIIIIAAVILIIIIAIIYKKKKDNQG